MKPLPLPVRVATGLAVSAAEHAKDLPRQLTGLPVTIASQMLQTAMRVQQQVTELAIKGDDVLAALRSVEDDTPAWATFDEDLEDTPPATRTGSARPDPAADTRDDADLVFGPTRADTNGQYPRVPPGTAEDDSAFTGEPIEDPWAEEERALAESRQDEELDEGSEADGDSAEAGPAWLPGYPDLTLPQVRARLRSMSEEQVAELLAYERQHSNRPSFVGMLSRRIANLRRQTEQGDQPDQRS
ncbi:lipid droplet-associated protein [Haloechinothrix sp. YIM 98757]|uniref:Lipid droplet-associated protein n=1 Tax=Haloechinothrix aidingensis TaxID=2752311 RepID=A0A837ZXP5_9PSEU|nr:lipid droplet-associated protein [Haloechinothrix aidingensis]MBA0125406.1 lipid droplet-associated protein [Haloechinothrix aidingensis]